MFLRQNFVEQLRQRTDQPNRFADLSELKDWFDAHQIEKFENKVRRGQLVRMSDFEVEKFRRNSK